MKRIVAIIFFALAVMVTVGTASAQQHKIRVTIPFDFNAGNTKLPAGTYTISSTDLIAVVIQNHEHTVTLLRTSPVEDNRSEFGKVVFDKSGDQYFLRKILASYAHLNLELPTSRSEKSTRLNHASLRADHQVFIALK
ncbi:hypothetical protein H7849_07475 [Alloacidobacterium dinghuense]|uniref:Uncharacterized protein n=1 Tax=Alloacidobacterium dinghuense TaxID=2763107 RepID=A0A7G8BMI1_9BACT|nr:hypothetical protein [Alloacidobacterium dinghuense]QNI33751.1 hypothetical protein H7849_07475 [Alloacidobacterium dinghuense]